MWLNSSAVINTYNTSQHTFIGTFFTSSVHTSQ